MNHERHRPSNHMVCFVLEPYPFLKEMDTSEHSNRVRENNLVFDEIVEPAVSAHGYRLVRSTELCRPNYVTREHQRLSEEEDLVIANLTHFDPLVFYCLAWRLAKNPKADLLVLLRHDQDRLIEAPVLNVPPVLYDLEPPDMSSPHFTLDDKADSMRRKVQLARRDLTRMVQHLVELNAKSAPAPYAPEPINVPPPQPVPQPEPPVNGTSQVVDEIMRQLLRRMENAGSGDIVERLSASLMKSSF